MLDDLSDKIEISGFDIDDDIVAEANNSTSTHIIKYPKESITPLGSENILFERNRSLTQYQQACKTLQAAQSSSYRTGYKRDFLNSMQYLLNDGKKKVIKLDSIIEKDRGHKFEVETLKVNSRLADEKRTIIFDSYSVLDCLSGIYGGYKNTSMDMITKYANKSLGGKPNPYKNFSQEEVNSVFLNFADLANCSSTYDEKFINKMNTMPEKISQGIDSCINTELHKIEKMIFGE